MRLFLTQQGLRGEHYGVATDSPTVTGTKRFVKNTATVAQPRVHAEDSASEIPPDLIGNYYF